MAITGKRKYEFSPDTTPDQVRLEIERGYSKNNPNVGRTESCFIKQGPQTYKFALIQQILDKETQEHHHNVLTLLICKGLTDFETTTVDPLGLELSVLCFW
ncbi:hypothetical protein HRG84_23660 [Flavisolibacter sp. BT320]|nr:hypothetical protein [Flavisolibacter longurius]